MMEGLSKNWWVLYLLGFVVVTVGAGLLLLRGLRALGDTQIGRNFSPLFQRIAGLVGRALHSVLYLGYQRR